MHKSRLGNVVIDCRTNDLKKEAKFWSDALGYPVLDEPDASGRFIQLDTPPGEVKITIQSVDHDPRAHLDIETDSIPAEVNRLERFGAIIVAKHDEWIVMQAPSGQRFCVTKPFRDGFDENANHWSGK